MIKTGNDTRMKSKKSTPRSNLKTGGLPVTIELKFHINFRITSSTSYNFELFI